MNKKGIVLILVAICLQLILACKSKKEKALEYLDRAKKENGFQSKSYYCDLALKNDPNLVEAYIIIGDLWAQGKGAVYDSALFNFNKALKLDPENSQALAYRAAVNNATGNNHKALSDVNKAICIRPDTFSYYKIRSEIFYDLGKYKSAEKDLKKAISLNGICLSCLYNLGVIVSEYSKDSAIMMYNRCLEIDENFVNALINRGLLYASAKEYDKAIADFTRGIEVDSSEIDFYKHRGTVYGIMDKNESAIKDFKTFLNKCQPNTPEYFDIKNAIEELKN